MRTYAEKNATVTARTRVKFHAFRRLLQFWGWLDETLRGKSVTDQRIVGIL
jgi:hypothetical protein